MSEYTIRNEMRLERKIISNNDDNKTLILNTLKLPYYFIGKVKTPTIIGTGTLIAPKIVLTCAHLICSTSDCKKIEFTPALNENFKPFNSSKIINFYIPKEFRLNEDLPNKYDWALLFLEHDFELKFSFYNLGNDYLKVKPINDFDINQKISLIGYPGDEKGKMFKSYGSIYEINDKAFSYKINTTTGQSGSPILSKINGVVSIIGVHQSSDLLIKERKGVKIEEYTLKNWGTRLKSDFTDIFRLYYKNPEGNSILNTLLISTLNEKDWTYVGYVNKKGLKEGFGTLMMKNGDKYIGEFKDNTYNGNGIYYRSNGERYEGKFKNGFMHGLGTFYKDAIQKGQERVYENGKRLI